VIAPLCGGTKCGCNTSATIINRDGHIPGFQRGTPAKTQEGELWRPMQGQRKAHPQLVNIQRQPSPTARSLIPSSTLLHEARYIATLTLGAIVFKHTSSQHSYQSIQRLHSTPTRGAWSAFDHVAAQATGASAPKAACHALTGLLACIACVSPASSTVVLHL
jgi:hypothetical protein